MSESLRTAQLKIWVDRARGGDAAAKDELIKAVCASMERLARQMLKGYGGLRAQVETGDVLQNALVRLLRSLEKFEPESTRHFFNLAATMIRRELIDLGRHFRGVRAARTNQDNPASSEPLVFDPPAPADSGVDVDRWREFHEAVERLPPEEREIVGLAFYHGWTQAETAELFQVNERTVRRWWESAIKRLREDAWIE